MKKNDCFRSEQGVPIVKKLFRMMKLTTFLLLISVIGVLASKSYSQTLSLKMENVTLKDVLSKMEDMNQCNFLYSEKFIDVQRKVSIDFENIELDDALKTLFNGTNIEFERKDRIIVLSQRGEVSVQQQKNIYGRVTDSSGAPLPGVTVVVKGTTQGTITNFDGSYTLPSIPGNGVLVFSFVGMKSQEVSVSGKQTININMVEDAIGIEEVVAVGYGTQKKTNLTGSVSTISSADIEKRQVGQASMALQGLAPGVTVKQNSGQPGRDGGTIRIRGIGTLGDSNPLVLVDGIAVDINSIDAADIESISVLKDAASAAIYGSRAANGVILITTKRADMRKVTISYRGYAGIQSPTNMPDLVNGLDHMLLSNEGRVNAGLAPTFSDEYLAAYRQNSPSDLYPDTDWQKLTLTNDGLMQGHAIDVSGGNDIVMTRASFNILHQNAIIPNTGFNRYSIRVNTDIKASEKLNFGVDLTGRDQLRYEPGVGAGEVFFAVNGRIPANMPGILSDGRYGEGWIGINPVSYAEASGRAESRTYSAIINLKGEWKPIDGMSINVNWTPSIGITMAKTFRRTIKTYFGNGDFAYLNPENSNLTQRNDKTKESNLKALVNYSRSFKDHNFKALLGFEQIENDYVWFSAFKENFLFEDYQVLNNGSEINQKASGSESAWALQSYFGRLNYDYLGKYLVEANLRYDGSSRFAEGHKWGVFPSFSAGWRISEEGFLKENRVIDNLKLRASWGRLGNQNIGNYAFASTVNIGQYYAFNEALATGGSLIDLNNESISWESSEMLNVGIDLTLFDKLSLTAEYYVKNTHDILLKLPLAYTLGLNPPFQNAGSVENIGWDMNLSYANKIGGFEYGVSAVLSDVRNKITDLRDTGPYIIGNTIRMVGQPIDAIYAYKYERIFQTPDEIADHATQFGTLAPGDRQYADISGPDGIPDGKVSADYDRTVLGSSIPRYTYSLNLNAAYKGFDMSLFLQGVGKADSYLDGSGAMTYTTRDLNRWTPDNRSTKFSRLGGTNNGQASSYNVYSAAYLRLKNMQIGYSIPKSLLNKTFLDYCRVYVAGENIFTFDKFLRGYDVESPSSDGAGTDGTGNWALTNIRSYPMVKVYSVGLNIKF